VTTLALRIAPPRSAVAERARFVAIAVLAGAAAIAGLAQVSVPLPFTPVPLTGQTLGVLLVGAAYGPGLGVATVGVYLLAAVAGMPVLAPNADGGHDTGLAVLGAAAFTGGYLWGFAVAAGVVGALARRGWDRSFRSAIGAMLLGEIAIFAVGLPWLAAALDGAGLPASLEDTLAAGLYPFVIGDTLKLLAAAALLPGAWRTLERFRPGEG
jgi:biotin transport system substrate-specific component